MEQRKDGVFLNLSPVGVWALKNKFAATLAVGLAACVLAYAENYPAGVVIGLVAAIQTVICLFVARRKPVFTVRENELKVISFFGAVLRSRQSTWPRDRLVALNSSGGLRILCANQEWCLFPERDYLEMAHVARMLREALQLSEEVPPRSHEMRVYFTGPVWPRPTPGILGGAQGELTLQKRFSSPLFYFQPPLRTSSPMGLWFNS